ncbi:type II secretion system protein GspL [Endozoicomonas elysicola]|uniref:Type II secretion system protein L n=1 Tax=Endozoicomonas elysicola TaxID=305900 RepID=A0A081KGP3_9GAMM|nr:type II secretion system protein GspL [Endozoicomonas elysicola]KEI73319.1 hypothetical protein GV64_23680 [Endozoicomonas elysicola]
MNSHLLLRLPDQPDQPVHWLLQSQGKQAAPEQASSNTIASGSWPTVAVFIEQYADSEITSDDATRHAFSESAVTVLVPTARVTVHSLPVQGRLTPAIRQSLPWRLEDEISEDVESLHFAVLGQDKDWVHLGVTRQSDMMLWQNWLARAGVHTKHWIPDALLLPVMDDHCCLLEFDGLVLARYGQWQIAACEHQWLPLFLDGLRKDRPDLEVTQANGTSDFPLNEPSRSTEDNLSPLSFLIPEASNTRINLLQGQWQPASPWRQRLLPWRSIAIMGCVLLSLLTINSVLSTQKLEQETQNLQQQAHGIYQQLFPGERVVRLQSQIRQKLAALQQPEDNAQSMLTMLAQITPVLNAFPELQASSMDYDDSRKSLRIQAKASDFELFTRFRERFETDLGKGGTKELNIAIEALERTGDKVTGMLVISGGVS